MAHVFTIGVDGASCRLALVTGQERATIHSANARGSSWRLSRLLGKQAMRPLHPSEVLHAAHVVRRVLAQRHLRNAPGSATVTIIRLDLRIS
jgi:hypothetical protein